MAAALAVGMAVAIAAIGDENGSDEVGGGVTRTPQHNSVARPTREPTTSAISVTPAPTRTQRPTATATQAPSPTAPTSAVALALWSETAGQWRPDSLAAADNGYSPGDSVPFMATWATTPGETHTVEIAYQCDGAVDFLGAVGDPAALPAGPGSARPDGAVPLPDIPGFSGDDGHVGLLLAFGGTFTLLPATPRANGDCDGSRSVTVPVRATGDTIALVGAAHLAENGSEEAALSVTVEGLGSNQLSIRR
jgi:uncharacterized cupin superfamily protein